jgi:Ca-activated chloride channel family protein
MRFLAAQWLVLLVAVAAMAVAYLLFQRRRSQYAVRFATLPLLEKVAPTRPGWRRHAPAVAFLLTLIALVLAIARPAAAVRVPRERATILVAVDTSVSMRATDVSPNRIDAAKEAARAFVDDLPEEFNVGLVSFSGAASVVVPPTTDRDAVATGIEALGLGERTAIGEAVYTALSSVESFDAEAATDPPPARIVLLSDGENTTGRSTEEAAAAAAEAQVPVSTIAYGTPDGTVEQDGRSIPVPVDAEALRQLAEVSGGASYAAESDQELRAVYDDIGSSIGWRTEHKEITTWVIALGLLSALVAGAASLLWFSRLP